ncbi:ABC transporter substrate-binding protein [Patulibacter defluvii]|uniref:ABC transporter substrate-binding protein n=1 Tax=Patulibacter defluvii TaxID=3095358 RepID=UPI002A75BDF2|nr:extracellular solute-binding protein [Patulibacter sp. DM4]
MRTWLKWVCTLALVGALGVFASGCGGSNDDKGGGGGGGSAGPPSPASVKGKIVVWDVFYKSFPSYTKAVPQLDAAFKRKYPNVEVEHVAQPLGEYSALQQAAFTGRQGPDVMMMPNAGSLRQFQKGLEELNDRITPEMQQQLSGWETVTPGYAVEGPHYGVPIAQTDFMFYYNKKLFRKAGLPADFQPKSWEELRDAGLKLKAAGVQPFTGGNKEGYESQWWWHMAWPTFNTKEQAVALAEGKLPFTDPAVARTFGPEEMMQKAGLFEKDRFTTPFFNDGYLRFADGKGAMVLGGSTNTAYWGDFNKALGEENVGMFLPPGSKYVSMQAEWAWSIPKFAENKDAAWAYIDFMASKEAILMLFDLTGEIPNRKDVPLPADAPPQARQIRDWYRDEPTFIATDVLVPSQVTQTMNTEAKEWLQGRRSLEDMLKSIQATADKVNR